MTEREKDDLFYVCSLIEFLGRLTKNTTAEVVRVLAKEGLAWNLEFADVNHCLSFEEVGDEMVKDYKIATGDFDSVAQSEFAVPDYTAIGSVYHDLILELKKDSDKELVDIMIDVFTSFISDEISDFNASTFYENPSYIYHSYLAGELLD